MNCITNFDCDYFFKQGLIENVNIISVNDDDCVVNILSNQILLRTSIENVKILIKPHEKITKANKIDFNKDLILTIDGYKCMVKALKVYDDETVEVIPTCGLFLDNEQTKRVSINDLMICGEYEIFNNLKSVSLPLPAEYSRYFNNISIFQPILSQAPMTMLSWIAEESTLRVSSTNETSLTQVEFVMPVFTSQLALLRETSGRPGRTLDLLATLLVWEYQYESELEANIAIGPQGAHILAVRALRGISGVVLTKSNRLRLIAENKSALREARSLLEIRRESYLFDDSFIPILIGKSASRISELVAKSGLHCIHVPNSPCSTNLNEHVSLIDRSISKKRELSLYGTKESIASAKLLLEVEESVRDLKKEFEQRKNSRRRLRQSQFSLKSSSTSSIVSKESRNKTQEEEDDGEDEEEEKEIDRDEEKDKEEEEDEDDEEEIFEDVRRPPIVLANESQPLSWADTHDDDEDLKPPGSESLPSYTDFYSTQSSGRGRFNQSGQPGQLSRGSMGGRRMRGGHSRKGYDKYFTNSMLCGGIGDERGECGVIPSLMPPQSAPQQKIRNHGNSNNCRMGGGGNGGSNNWNHYNFRSKVPDRRSGPHQHYQKPRRSSPTDRGNTNQYNQAGTM